MFPSTDVWQSIVSRLAHIWKEHMPALLFHLLVLLLLLLVAAVVAVVVSPEKYRLCPCGQIFFFFWQFSPPPPRCSGIKERKPSWIESIRSLPSGHDLLMELW
jgi:hypothetical protein